MHQLFNKFKKEIIAYKCDKWGISDFLIIKIKFYQKPIQ